MDTAELTAANSADGGSLDSPFTFIQQALHSLAVTRFDTLNAFTQVDVTIHIGKGNHFFFACVTELHPNLDQYTTANPDLQPG